MLNRLSQPWLSKGSLILAIIYGCLLPGIVVGNSFAFSLFMAYAVLVGIVGLGYFINDYFDLEADLKVGKSNIVQPLNGVQRFFLLSLLVFMSLLPWMYLPFTAISFILLITELFLFLIYSVKPIRLKDRAEAGVITDALYAHAIPGLFAAYTFLQLSNSASSLSVFGIVLFASWLFIMGLRNILIHQIDDHKNDLLTHTHTFATKYGVTASRAKIRRLLVPFELILFYGWCFVLHPLYHWIAFVFLVYTVYIYFREIVQFKTGKRSVVDIHEGGYDFLNAILLNEFYEKWLPMIILILLSIEDMHWMLFLFIHIILFWPNTRKFKSDFQFIFSTVFKYVFYLFMHIVYYKVYGNIKHYLYWKVYIPMKHKKESR